MIIYQLLHNRIKPVFVFDGATPTLKIQTVRTRRLLREKQEINVKKTAEKILLAKLKQHLTSQIKNSQLINNDNLIEDNYTSRYAPGFNPLPDSNVVENIKNNQNSEKIQSKSSTVDNNDNNNNNENNENHNNIVERLINNQQTETFVQIKESIESKISENKNNENENSNNKYVVESWINGKQFVDENNELKERFVLIECKRLMNEVREKKWRIVLQNRK